MQRVLAAAALAFASLTAAAQNADLALTRFECGTPRPNVDANTRFSDTFAYDGLKLTFVFSCYLIKHGNDYMIWDTGFGPGAENAPKLPLPDQLAKMNVKREQVKFVGISHYHGDHIGGAQFFPDATLLIGKGDWDLLASGKAPQGVDGKPLAHWLSGGGKVEPVPLDKDVFGDGTVMMLYTPGHTPGHHSLLVKLPQTGNVLLTGDLAHFHENYDGDGVPSFNHDRAQTVASIERFKKIAAKLKAKVVIQHDARDVNILPNGPDSAK